MGRKKNITCATKNTKMIITRRESMKNFSRALALKTRGWLKID
jgi:hypothetical protein